jgi:hypothetical protein
MFINDIINLINDLYKKKKKKKKKKKTSMTFNNIKDLNMFKIKCAIIS